MKMMLKSCSYVLSYASLNTILGYHMVNHQYTILENSYRIKLIYSLILEINKITPIFVIVKLFK